MPAELPAVCSERVGADYVSAGSDVGGVNRPHPVRIGTVQVVEGTPSRNAAGVERGAEGAVPNPGPLPQESRQFRTLHEPPGLAVFAAGARASRLWIQWRERRGG